MLACTIDGRPCTMAEATIPVTDHGLLYGDGVFEGLRFYNGKVFRLAAHLNRLEDSARAIALSLPLSHEAMTQTIQAAIADSNVNHGYIRLLVTRGSGPLGIDPSTCSNPRTIVIVDELKMVDPADRARGLKVIIAATRRLSADQFDPRIKSLNYLNQIMARIEAQVAGAHEAILLNQAGRVAEGTADNVFIVKRGILMTPPTTEGALDGITRSAILEVAAREGIAMREAPLAVFDLYTADECFLSGTGAELIPVASIGGRAVNPAGPVFDRLSAGFSRLIEEETR